MLVMSFVPYSIDGVQLPVNSVFKNNRCNYLCLLFRCLVNSHSGVNDNPVARALNITSS